MEMNLECLTNQLPAAPKGVDAWAAAIGGGCLLACGMTGRLGMRWPVLAVGGWLFARGVISLCKEHDATDFSKLAQQPRRELCDSRPPEDRMDEAIWESFPASDPPAHSISNFRD